MAGIEKLLFWVPFHIVLRGIYGGSGLAQTFEGEERSTVELKRIFLLSLFNWMTALRGFAIPSLLDFLDLYSSGQLFFYTKNGLKKNQITS